MPNELMPEQTPDLQAVSQRLDDLLAYATDLVQYAHTDPLRFAGLVEANEYHWRWQMQQIATGTPLEAKQRSFGSGAERCDRGEG